MSIPASERHQATGGRRGAGTRPRPGVALVIQHYPPFMAGAERQARLLAETLAACLGSSDVITTRFRPDLPLRTEEDGVRVRRLRTCSVGGLRHLVNFLSALVYFLRNGHRYTVVHAHCLSAFSLGAILGAQVRGCRTLLKVCSIGEAGETVKLRRHALGPLLWAMARRADTFIAPTPALVERLVRDGFPAERIVVLPNMVSIGLAGPIDEAMRAAARKDLGLAERPTILFVGRMADGKGLDTLMQAWGDVAAEHDAGLVLVGDGPEAGRVARWAREEGRARTVRLAGRQEHPEAFYRAADILAFPSQEETFGNVLIEAMAHGLAVVSTRVGVAADCLRHGDNGLLVPHAEPAELTRAIDRLIRDVPLRERLGRAARREVVERFAPAPIARRHLELYGLLDARRAASGES